MLRLVDEGAVKTDNVAGPRAVRAPGQEDTLASRPRFGGQPALQRLPAHRAEPGPVQQVPLRVAAEPLPQIQEPASGGSTLVGAPSTLTSPVSKPAV